MKKLNLLLKTLPVILFPVTMFSQSWVTRNSGTTQTLWTVHFIDANNGYAAGDAGTVRKTTDGGVTWTAANIATTNPIRDIFFTDVCTGWAAVGDVDNSASSGAIWHTTNGGTTWTSQTPSTTEARLGISFANSTTGWAVGSRNGPINIDYTTNAGTTWVGQSNSGIFGWLYKVDAVSATTAYTIGGAFFPSVTGMVIKTTDAGATWTQSNTGTIPFLFGMDFFNSTTGWVVGESGKILSTADGGTTWATQTSGVTDTLMGVSFISATAGWVCGSGGKILYTSDAGAAWSPQTSGVTTALQDVFAVSAGCVWAVGESGAIVTTCPTGTVTNPCPTGINELGGSIKAIEVYPNPSGGVFTIQMDKVQWLMANETISTIEIYNVLGEKIYSSIINPDQSGSTIINLDASSGIYSISVLNKGNVIGRGKLVVK